MTNHSTLPSEPLAPRSSYASTVLGGPEATTDLFALLTTHADVVFSHIGNMEMDRAIEGAGENGVHGNPSPSRCWTELEAWAQRYSREAQKEALRWAIVGMPDSFWGQPGPSSLWVLDQSLTLDVSVWEEAPKTLNAMFGRPAGMFRWDDSHIARPMAEMGSSVLVRLLAQHEQHTDDATSNGDWAIWTGLMRDTGLFDGALGETLVSAWAPSMEQLTAQMVQRAALQDLEPHTVVQVLWEKTASLLWAGWRLQHPDALKWTAWTLDDTLVHTLQHEFNELLRRVFDPITQNGKPEDTDAIRQQIGAALSTWMTDATPVAETLMQRTGGCRGRLQTACVPLDVWMDCVAQSGWSVQAQRLAWPSAARLIDGMVSLSGRAALGDPQGAIATFVQKSPFRDGSAAGTIYEGALGGDGSGATDLVRRLQQYVLEALPLMAGGQKATSDAFTRGSLARGVAAAEWARQSEELGAMWMTRAPGYIKSKDFVVAVTGWTKKHGKKQPQGPLYEQAVALFEGTNSKLTGTIAMSCDIMGWPQPYTEVSQAVLALGRDVRSELQEFHNPEVLRTWDAHVEQRMLLRALGRVGGNERETMDGRAGFKM